MSTAKKGILGIFKSNKEKCKKCQKTVYAMEKVVVNNMIFHNTCFKCFTCKKTLNATNYNVHGDDVFCAQHYKLINKETPEEKAKREQEAKEQALRQQEEDLKSLKEQKEAELEEKKKQEELKKEEEKKQELKRQEEKMKQMEEEKKQEELKKEKRIQEEKRLEEEKLQKKKEEEKKRMEEEKKEEKNKQKRYDFEDKFDEKERQLQEEIRKIEMEELQLENDDYKTPRIKKRVNENEIVEELEELDELTDLLSPRPIANKRIATNITEKERKSDPEELEELDDHEEEENEPTPTKKQEIIQDEELEELDDEEIPTKPEKQIPIQQDSEELEELEDHEEKPLQQIEEKKPTVESTKPMEGNPVIQQETMKSSAWGFLTPISQEAKEIPQVEDEIEEKSKEFFEKATEEFKKRDLKKAIEFFTEAIKINQFMVQAYFNRGVAFYNLKEYQNSIQDMDFVLEYQPRNLKALSTRGLSFKSLREYKKAIFDFKMCEIIDPTFTHNINALATCYFENEDYEYAIKYFSKLNGINEIYQNYYFRAKCYFKLLRYDLSIEDYNKAIELCEDEEIKLQIGDDRQDVFSQMSKEKDEHGDEHGELKHILNSGNNENIELLRNKAHGLINAKNYNDALEIISKLIDLTNDINEIYLRGICYRQTDQIEKSIVDFETVVKQNPNHLQALLKLANSYKKLDNRLKTIKYLTKIINLEENSKYYFERGTLYFEQDEFTNAVSDFSKSIELDSNNMDSFYNRGIIYHRHLNEHELAMKDYNKAIELSNSKDIDVLLDRAILHYDMDQEDLFTKELNLVLKKDPNNERALNLLSQ